MTPPTTALPTLTVERVERIRYLNEQVADQCVGEGDKKIASDIAALCSHWLSHNSPARADEWQPIETAPRDGRNVILCKANASHTFVGSAKTMGGTATYWFDDTGHMREPTHWKPLPPPINTAEKAREGELE